MHTKNTLGRNHTAKSLFFLFLLFSTALMIGCNDDKKMIESVYSVADELIRQLPPPDKNEPPILCANFVNIDNLEKSSTLGRIISEYIASRFVQRGYLVAELKIRDSIYIKKQTGEFLLSRDINHLNPEQETNSLIVGTYSVGADRIYLSAKVVSATDSIIIATYDFSMPITNNVSKMLSGR